MMKKLMAFVFCTTALSMSAVEDTVVQLNPASVVETSVEPSTTLLAAIKGKISELCNKFPSLPAFKDITVTNTINVAKENKGKIAIVTAIAAAIYFRQEIKNAALCAKELMFGSDDADEVCGN